MVTLSPIPQTDVKKVHCSICGGRICDVRETEKICLGKDCEREIVVKCYKCGNKIGVSIE